MRGGKTGLAVVGVGEGGVGAQGRCVWASWWARSWSKVCSRLDNRVTSWSEFSSGSECSASEAESRVCSQVPHHKYQGLFCGYKMVVDVGAGGVGARGRCMCASWWARSRSRVRSRSDDKVTSW